MRCLMISSACACLVALAMPAHGQSARTPTAEDRAQAQALFDQGTALMKSKDYQAACPKLEASLERFDGIGTRGKLAQCYERAGRVASAWAMYREVEALASKSGDEARASVAREAARALEPRLPHLTLTVATKSQVEGLLVRRNGAEVASGAWGAPIAVDPGKHSLEASAPGYAPWAEEVEVQEGESKSVEVPALAALPPEAQPAPSATPEVGEKPARGSSLRPVAMIATGVGVVSLAVGGYFGLRAKSKWDGAFDDGHCASATNVCDATGQEQTDQARSAATLSNVFIGAGAVLAAGGVTLWLLAPKERAPSQTAVRVVPVAAPKQGGLWLEGMF